MKLLIWRDADEKRIYVADTTEDRYRAALDIVKKRLEWDFFFYPEGTEARAKKILETKDGPEALRLLDERKDYEYEGIEFMFTEDPVEL